MDDAAQNAALRAQIAALEAKIENKRRHGAHAQTAPVPSPFRGAPRWAPYAAAGRGRGRGHQVPPPPTDFVATHPHQLVNKDALERQQKRALELQAAKRQKATELSSKKDDTRELVMDGIRFKLRVDGGKLTRVKDVATDHLQTPKVTKIAGVDFYRTKNGNLIRSAPPTIPARYSQPLGQVTQRQNSLLDYSRPSPPTHQPQCENFTKHGTLSSFNSYTGYSCGHGHPTPVLAVRPRPSANLSLGKCPFGQSCRFAHDPEKVAICPAFLKNKCTDGDYCDLSHTISYRRVPACHHFLRGNCTNDACRYPHVKVSPSAPVCPPFARLGYCASEECNKRHIFECPEYASNGVCTNKGCQLPHIDHAHVLRNAAAKQGRVKSDREDDVPSDDEDAESCDTSGDADSDNADDLIMADDGGHELSQQHDYVPFY